MPITSLNDYINAPKQTVNIVKTASRTSLATMPFNLIDIAGSPGAGVLAGSNTANGVVPTGVLAGYPLLNPLGVSGVGVLSKVQFSNTVAGRIGVYDNLFTAGAYSFNSAVTLASQPSYAGRVPGNVYVGLQLWICAVTAFTGSLSVNITYVNESGVDARTTGTVSLGTLTVGRMVQLPLQSGDSGIQRITGVTASVSTAGTFNVMVMRPLWEGRVTGANGGDVHDMLKTGLPLVYETSAIQLIVNPDSTASGIPQVQLEITNN